MNLDDTFKKNIQELKGIPTGVNWDKQENWEFLVQQRKSQSRLWLKKQLAIAASITLIAFIAIFYRHTFKTNIEADNVKREYLKQYEKFLSNNINSAYIVDYTNQISPQYKIIRELDDVIILYNNY